MKHSLSHILQSYNSHESEISSQELKKMYNSASMVLCVHPHHFISWHNNRLCIDLGFYVEGNYPNHDIRDIVLDSNTGSATMKMTEYFPAFFFLPLVELWNTIQRWKFSILIIAGLWFPTWLSNFFFHLWKKLL